MANAYTKEELAKMPKDKRDKIEQTRAEIEKRLINASKQSIDVADFVTENTSERVYNSKFSKMYVYVRKALVTLKAKKQLGELSGEELYNTALEVLENAKTL